MADAKAYEKYGVSMPTVFLSHSSQDRTFVQRLASDLRANGIDVWYDKWEIKVGDSIVSKINEAIASRDYLAVVLTPQSVSSRWVQIELNAALIRELTQRSVFVLPILAESCTVPSLIADKRHADFTKDYYLGLAELLAVLVSGNEPTYIQASRHIVDANAHLWMDCFSKDIGDVLARARMRGVEKIVASGCSGVDSWIKCLNLAEQHDFVYASLALHPYLKDTEFGPVVGSSPGPRKLALAQLRQFVQRPQVVSLGDAHLNYLFLSTCSREMQMQMFEAHCVMGADFGLPVIVEVRNSTDAGSLDAEADFWQVRKHFRGLAVIVQLPVSQTFVERSKDEEDLCFLVAGNITYPRAKSIRSLLTQIPLDHLILGSDAPALAPHPHRGKRNEPAYLTHSLEVISNSLEQTLDEIAITTTATANRIFRFESARAAQRSSPPKRPSFG